MVALTGLLPDEDDCVRRFGKQGRIMETEISIISPFESGARDGNRTNPNEPDKALPPAFRFNWSQMESDLP